MEQEYMLLVRNKVDHLTHLSAEENQKFLKACEDYIARLKQAGKLKAAQPLVKDGTIISGSKASWQTKSIRENEEIQVGYYHILADSMEDAIEIAKENPEFQYTSTVRVEVRPVKMKEQSTQFVYPNKN